MLNKLRRKLREREGSSMIEFAMALFIFVIVTAFIVDMLFVGHKRFLIARETTDISRTLAVQGGVASAVPVGYPGGDRAYLTSKELYLKLDDTMSGANIERDEWSVKLTEYNTSGEIIRNIQLTPQTSFKIDYMNSMDIEIDATYNWKLMRIITAGALDEAGVGAKRHAVSEFKYNFDEWEGEGY